MEDEPRKALHLYRREATDEELQRVAQYLAEGRTKSWMAREMGQTTDRITRLCKRIEVQQAAVRIRETQLIPQALQSLENKQSAVLDVVMELVETQRKLERTVAAMAMAMSMRKLTMERNRQTIKNLRKERNELRQLIRRRGIV